MSMIDLLYSLFFDYTLRTVALGTMIIGLTSGALGSFAFLRRQSLLGDAISHAALPGVVLAFILTHSKASFVLVLGAMIAGWLSTLLLIAIVRFSRIKEDTALGLILSVFFGIGLLLLSYTQRLPDAQQAGLNRFLFGQAATIIVSDVILMAVLSMISLVTMVLFWKEFKLISFDPDFAASLGLPTRLLEILLTTLLVIGIVIGLQAVGVILMSAMVVAPAAAARQWTNRLSIMVGLAMFFGALSSVSGVLISSVASGLSTGPVIVLCITVIVLFSLAFAPSRGLLWKWIKDRRNRSIIRSESLLANMYTLNKEAGDVYRPYLIADLPPHYLGERGLAQALNHLVTMGYIKQLPAGEYQLTLQGLAYAESLLNQTVSSSKPLYVHHQAQV